MTPNAILALHRAKRRLEAERGEYTAKDLLFAFAEEFRGDLSPEDRALLLEVAELHLWGVALALRFWKHDFLADALGGTYMGACEGDEHPDAYGFANRGCGEVAQALLITQSVLAPEEHLHGYIRHTRALWSLLAFNQDDQDRITREVQEVEHFGRVLCRRAELQSHVPKDSPRPSNGDSESNPGVLPLPPRFRERPYGGT